MYIHLYVYVCICVICIYLYIHNHTNPSYIHTRICILQMKSTKLNVIKPPIFFSLTSIYFLCVHGLLALGPSFLKRVLEGDCQLPGALSILGMGLESGPRCMTTRTSVTYRRKYNMVSGRRIQAQLLTTEGPVNRTV